MSALASPESAADMPDFSYLTPDSPIEDFEAYGHLLSERFARPDGTPVPPLAKHVRQASAEGWGPPPTTIHDRFDQIARFQDAMGYVTEATLARWTDEEWIQNGQWLAHLLGSQDAPVVPTMPALRAGRRALLCPYPDAVLQKYGSMANYQRALGLEPLREKKLGYDQWDRKTFIQNGVWLSHAMGTPEHPRMPVRTDIDEASSLGLCPPLTAIQKRFGRSLERYQDAIGFVVGYTLKRWTDEDWLNNGRWAAHALGSPDKPRQPKKSDLGEGKAAHVTPSAYEAARKFGTFTTYQTKLEVAPNSEFRTWPPRRWLAHALDVTERMPHGRLPTSPDFDRAEGPSGRNYEYKFGSLGKLYQRLDVRDYSRMTRQQVITFGIRLAAADDGRLPTWRELEDRHAQGRGPSRAKTDPYYGFIEAVQEQLPYYQKAADELAQFPEITPKLASHLLRDYQPGRDFEVRVMLLANQLALLERQGYSHISWLTTMFARSRNTVRWDKEDFAHFGMAAFRRRDLRNQDYQEILDILDEAALAPFPEDIQEVFGSPINLVDATIAHAQEVYATARRRRRAV